MRRIETLRSIVLLTAALLVGVSGCLVNDKTGSLWDPDLVSPRPNPTITAIAPPGGAQAAVDTIVITGTNFSPTPRENTVYFDAAKASIVSATASQLRVLPPAVIGDAIKIKVAVFGAELFSNTVTYRLSAAVESFGGLGPTETAGAIAPAPGGTLLVSIKPEGANARIYRYSAGGARVEYAPETAGTPQWTSLRLGPGGYLYAVRNVRAIYRFAPGGGSAAVLWVAFPTGVFAVDFDFDQNQNLWVGGNNTNIYLVRPNATTKTFPFTGNVRSVRVYEGHLYFAATTGSGDQIWRAPISGEDLGTPEVYFDLSAAFGGRNLTPRSITFSSDGTLFIATDAPECIVTVTPSKIVGAPYRGYASLFEAGALTISGIGDALYASTQTGKFLKVAWRKTGAPYYGQ